VLALEVTSYRVVPVELTKQRQQGEKTIQEKTEEGEQIPSIIFFFLEQAKDFVRGLGERGQGQSGGEWGNVPSSGSNFLCTGGS